MSRILWVAMLGAMTSCTRFGFQQPPDAAPQLEAAAVTDLDASRDVDSGAPDTLVPDLPLGCTVDADCDDGNACTADSCLQGECVRDPTNEGQPCDDLDACTDSDACVLGVCTGKPASCAAKPCENVSCNPSKGCVVTSKPEGAICDDKNPCTQGETCVSQACKAPPPINQLVAKAGGGGSTDRTIATDSKGHVHILFDEPTSGLRYATNESGAWVITPIDAANPDVGHQTLFIDGQDVVHVAYIRTTAGKLMYTALAPGSAWTAPVVLTNATRGSGIAVDGNGGIHIAFGYQRNLRYIKGKPGAWGQNVILNMPSSSTTSVVVSTSISMVIDVSGGVHIAHSMSDTAPAVSEPIELRYTSNTGGAWSTNAPAGLAVKHGGSASIAIGGTGDPFIAHHSLENGTLYLTWKSSSGWKTQTMDSGSVGSFGSLVLDSMDNVHVAYRRWWGTGQLRHVTNASGAGFKVAILDQGSDCGRQTSITRAPSGRLHITYRRGAVDELRHHSISACP